MSDLVREALAFVEYLTGLYLAERDMEQILAAMEGGVSWIGTGMGEVCHGLEEARDNLEAELREYPGGFTVTGSRLETTPLGPDVCLVSGEITARPVSGGDMAELPARLSLVCRRTGAGMRLVHLHLSHSDRDQASGEYYVRQKALADRDALRAMVEDASRALEMRSREMEDLLNHVPGGVYQCWDDDSYTILTVNRNFLEMFGYSRAELRERFHDHFLELVCPEDREDFLRKIHTQLTVGSALELEYRIRCKDGSAMWVLDKGIRVPAPDGTATIYCMLVDVTKRKRMEEALRLSLERHRIIMDQATDVIFEWDILADSLSFSANWEKKFGYEPIRSRVTASLPCSHNLHPDDIPALLALMKGVAGGAPYSETEFRIRNSGGKYLWCRIRATGQSDDLGRPIKAVGVIVDIDASKKHEHQLMEQAMRDGLTGLYNRNTVKALVERHLEASPGPHALMIVDLDGFKGINDRCGHLCGDAVLSDMASTLQHSFRDRDVLGRIGGDEFLVFLPGVRDREAAGKKAAGLLRAIAQILVDGSTPLSCSVGVALAPEDGRDYNTLYERADRALYQVKNGGRGAYAFYEEGPGETAARSAVSRVIDSDLTELNRYLGQYAFRMLYSAKNVPTAIQQILEIVGRACDVGRVYIFEDLEGGRACRNTFEWCNDGVTPEIGNLQHLVYSEGYRELFDEKGIFYCPDVRELSPEAYAVLAPQGIYSMLQCAIMENGKMVGFVGFDECRHNRHWSEDQIHALELVANVLSVFLLKERMKELLEQLAPSASQQPSAPHSQPI